MLIEVTQQDIDTGRARDCLMCPIALAVMRASGKKYASVSPYNFGCSDTDPDSTRGRWKRYRMPVAARIFVSNFDRGLPVAPFSFEAEFIYDY